MAEMLPPATQAFILDAAQYIAGVDEMIAGNVRLAESITGVMDEMKAMEAMAAKGSKVGPVSAGGAGNSAAAGETAAAQTQLSEAEKRAAEAAKLEAEMQADLVREQKMLAESSRLVADAQAQVAVKSKLAGDAEAVASEKHSTAGIAAKSAASGLVDMGKATTLAGVAFAAYGVKSAADYQTEIVKLKTSAGETGDLIGGKFTGGLKTASDGILKISVDTATSTKQLTSGMYMVESAGFHGAKGLDVLRVAAEGAKAEGADLGVVGQALTTLLNDFPKLKGQPVVAMNQLIATVAHGKTTMQDLASALHSVLPVANKAGLSYAQVGGAIATMTSHGVTADLATQHLSNMIRNLATPLNPAAQEMANLGLSALDVSKNLGRRGLTGTLDLLMKAITSHMGPDGLVLIHTFNQSKEAAASANTMLSAMPKKVHDLAAAFLANKITVADYNKALKGLSPDQNVMGHQFETAVQKSRGFTNALRNNRGAAETVSSALKKMTGGAVGLETALQLTGSSAGDFSANVKAVGDASKSTGKHVENWQLIQKTFNFQLGQVQKIVEKLAINLGTVLIPKIMAVVKWFEKHKQVAKDLAYLIAGVLTLSVVAFGMKLAAFAAKPIIGLYKLGKAIKGVELGAKLAGAATKIWSGIQMAFNLIMDANPVMLLVIAIAALVAGVVYCYLHFKTFRDIVNSVFEWLKGAVVAVIHFVEKHWRLIIAIIGGPLGIVVALVTKYWSDIRKWFMDGVHGVEHALEWFGNLPSMFWGWISGAAAAVGRGIVSINNWFLSLPGRILNAIGDAGSMLLQTGKNIVIGLWNGLVSMGTWLWNSVTGWIKNVIPGPILHVLGINSPSKWAHWAGQMVGQGMANGMTSTMSIVGQAAEGLATHVQKRLTTAQSLNLMRTSPEHLAAMGNQAALANVRASAAGWGQSVAGGVLGVQSSGWTSGSSSNPAFTPTTAVTVNVYNAGSVIAQRDLESSIQSAVLQTNVRNPTNGYSIPSGR